MGEVMNSTQMRLMGLIVAAAFWPTAGAQAAVRYVALDGSGANGLTWATAYKTVQAALNDSAMTTGGEIRIKEGTYPISQPIVVTKAVRILGGYSGTGDTRDWLTYRTTIDGQETTLHCFWVTANATIDGVGIMYAWATGTNDNDLLGAGASVIQCAATISNCLFKNNFAADSGAGVGTYQATGTKITGCTFTQNTANIFGGAIYNEEGTGLQILDCSFLGNASNDSAAAIYNLNCGVTIARCVFQQNVAGLVDAGVGGAILNDASAATVKDSIFQQNKAPYGGAILNYECNALIDNCWFYNCDPATLNGGGVYNFGGAPTIQNCLFEQNAVQDTGGAIMDRGSGGKTINCIIWRNAAQNGGGAIYITPSTETGATNNPQFINCTIYDNSTVYVGGGVFCEDTNASFVNCIVWGNSAGGGWPGIGSALAPSAGKPLVRYSDVQGTTVYPGVGNKLSDPMFVDPDNGDITLSFDSPCLDSGSNAAVLGVLEDYDGGTRIVDGDGNGVAIVDMGALELQAVQDHLTHGQIIRSTAYDDASDTTAAYTFLLRLETDDVVTSVDFQAPGGTTVYTIPSTDYTSAGNVETYHRVDGTNHVWEYWVKSSSASALSPYGDGTYRIVAHYRNNTQAETRIACLVPGTSNPVPQPTQKPQITTPAFGATVPSPVVLKWNACTDGAANAIYVTISDAATGAEAASDVLAKTATQSGEYRLAENNYDAEVAFANLYEVASTDGTPFQYGKTVLVGHQLRVPYSAVYRFWSPSLRHHFYTTSVKERDKLIKNYPNIAWTYEGIAFYACLKQSNSSLRPVYRLWSGQSHFFTIDENEKSSLLAQTSPRWVSEGIAFYAYPEGYELSSTKAVYRFLNTVSGSPFLTINETEANAVITAPDSVFTYQGVAFYAYPP
jgi:hypothetical protein